LPPGLLVHRVAGTPELRWYLDSGRLAACTAATTTSGWSPGAVAISASRNSRKNALAPPLPYPNESFDLITALSVFTHLPEPLQLPWISELRRVLRPGGLLALSVHGRASLDKLGPDERAAFEAGRLVVQHASEAGSNRCAAYHPERYVREMLAQQLVLLEHVAEGARGNPPQDLLLLRR
jgi:SAM-dependent methyltransferase